MKSPLSLIALASYCLLVCCSCAKGSPASQPASTPTPSSQSASAQAAPSQSSTALLSSADFSGISARIDRKLIPNLVDEFKPDRQQSFSIKGPDFPPFDIVPVRYESTSDDSKQPTFRCGVYVLPANGPTTFVRTLGYDNREPELCDGLLGVGFMPTPSGPPRIILLYNGGSSNYPGKDPVILDWDASAKRYASNDKIVNNLKNVGTIPAIKAQLKTLAPR